MGNRNSVPSKTDGNLPHLTNTPQRLDITPKSEARKRTSRCWTPSFGEKNENKTKTRTEPKRSPIDRALSESAAKEVALVSLPPDQEILIHSKGGIDHLTAPQLVYIPLLRDLYDIEKQEVHAEKIDKDEIAQVVRFLTDPVDQEIVGTETEIDQLLMMQRYAVNPYGITCFQNLYRYMLLHYNYIGIDGRQTEKWENLQQIVIDEGAGVFPPTYHLHHHYYRWEKDKSGKRCFVLMVGRHRWLLPIKTLILDVGRVSIPVLNHPEYVKAFKQVYDLDLLIFQPRYTNLLRERRIP